MKNDNGVFKGSTIEAIANIRSEINEFKKINGDEHVNIIDKVDILSKKYWYVIILLVIAIVERLPEFAQLIFAVSK